jgi:hypothetical protein
MDVCAWARLSHARAARLAVGRVKRAATAEVVAVAALLAAMAALLVQAARADGVTNDEVLYIAAGYRHLAASDYRLNPTTPPLAKLVCALGLLGLRVQEPPQSDRADEMDWSYRFLHVANDATMVLHRARAPVIVLTLLLAGLIWWWARTAGGPGAALLALALAVFHPSLLAHGHLATTDVAAALAMLTASFCAWRFLERGGRAWAAGAGLAVGAAAATRLTGWLLLPSLVVVGAAVIRRGQRRTRDAAILLLAVATLVPLVVWAAYGFHDAPWAGSTVARSVQPRLGLPGAMVGAARRAHLFPEAYLEGARYQVEHGTTGHPGYLLGERSRTGWWHYFLVAFAVKNTPGFLLLFSFAVVVTARRRPRAAALVHWLVPAAAVFLVASVGRVQIGERYILPLYPYLILFTATALAPALRSPRARWVVVAGLLLHALPVLRQVPHGHLAYFNLLAGGWAGGHRVLLDSNLDWGQDLPRLAAWMRREGVARVQLGYHGSDVPARLGIAHDDLPGEHLYPARPPARPFAGVVAVSPNLLWGLFPGRDDLYAPLRERPPDGRAGIFFVYGLGGESRNAAARAR